MKIGIRNTLSTIFVCLAASSPSLSQDQQKTWMVCGIWGGGTVALNTKPVQINWTREVNLQKAKLYIYAKNAGLPATSVTCSPFQSLDDLRDEHRIGTSYETHQNGIFTTAEWPGLPADWHLLPAPVSKASAVPAAPIKPTIPGALIVEDNGNAARLKAWDNVILQAKRAEAARKVQIAALTAESKAEYKRIMDKAIAEARKKGRMQ